MDGTPMKYTLLGVDDEITTCEHCGKSNLKNTVVLGVLDADGTVVGDTRFGRDCAATALGRRKGSSGAKVDVIEREARNVQAARLLAGVPNSRWRRVQLRAGRFPVWARLLEDVAQVDDVNHLPALQAVTGDAYRYVGHHRGQAVYVRLE